MVSSFRHILHEFLPSEILVSKSYIKKLCQSGYVDFKALITTMSFQVANNQELQATLEVCDTRLESSKTVIFGTVECAEFDIE